jgi:hypothetical protein
MGFTLLDYKCPLDGSPLSFKYGEENDSYRCSHCGTIYPTLSKCEEDILRDIEVSAILKLEKYKKRLEKIKGEERDITKILEFVEKSGLLNKLNKVNLSEQKQHENT